MWEVCWKALAYLKTQMFSCYLNYSLCGAYAQPWILVSSMLVNLVSFWVMAFHRARITLCHFDRNLPLGLPLPPYTYQDLMKAVDPSLLAQVLKTFFWYLITMEAYRPQSLSICLKFDVGYNYWVENIQFLRLELRTYEKHVSQQIRNMIFISLINPFSWGPPLYSGHRSILRLQHLCHLLRKFLLDNFDEVLLQKNEKTSEL